jgi:hypothetical protein
MKVQDLDQIGSNQSLSNSNKEILSQEGKISTTEDSSMNDRASSPKGELPESLKVANQ